MKILGPGDPCPCCGRPIKTRDPVALRLLTMIAATRRFPTAEEIHNIVEEECSHEKQRSGAGDAGAGAGDVKGNESQPKG
ncbi:hypothetical protein F260042K2_10160 [Flavonifractor plautii]